ncbi:MAG: hypothetical protein JW920_02375 [Deltaproteobacteria bacterium]|nr:hypothetical protein [Deltaproteobacteria bacterium]
MNKIRLKKQRVYGPDVFLQEYKGQLVVQKTYRHRILPVRTLGMGLIAWEAFIYSKLAGIKGIPKLIVKPDRYSLSTSFMGGENLRETRKRPDNAYFDEVEKIITSMHARGVVHLDLRNRRNYGIDDCGMPYLMDFANCLYLPWPHALKTCMARIDWMGYLKIKYKMNPDLVSPIEYKRLSLGQTLSTLWLPGKAFKALKNIIKQLRS